MKVFVTLTGKKIISSFKNFLLKETKKLKNFRIPDEDSGIQEGPKYKYLSIGGWPPTFMQICSGGCCCGPSALPHTISSTEPQTAALGLLQTQSHMLK